MTTLAQRHSTQVTALREDEALRGLGLVVHDVLGEGGSAIVFRARDERHGRDVAIKVLRHSPALERAAERFSQEIRVAGRLRHPHILPLFDSGTLADGRRFAVMPVAHGRPLRDLISEGPLDLALAVQLARELAEALEHLHAQGFVHRDVKPENVLVESGHAVLTDFGLAVPMHSVPHAGVTHTAEQAVPSDADAARFTATGRVVGTPRYMSPEALLGDEPLDGRTDQYALGMVLFEMLTGEVPYGDMTPAERMAQVLRQAVPSVHTRRADVPVAVDAIIARCTARHATDRYASAAALAAALRAADTASRDTARVAGAGARRRRRSIGIAAAAVLVLGAIAWLRDSTLLLDPHRVVVADLANDTGDASMDGIGELAGDVIAAGLTADSTLEVVNATIALPSHLQVHLPAADSSLSRQTRALVRSTRAGLAVTGAFFRAGRGLEVLSEVTDTRTDRVLGVAGPVFTAPDHPDSSLRVLRDSVRAILRRHA